MVWCPKAVAARSGFLGGSLLPVSRPSVAVGYGDDLNSLILDSIHNQERESPHQVAAGTGNVGRVQTRSLGDSLDGSIQLHNECGGGIGTPIVVPRLGGRCLGSSLGKELDGKLHRLPDDRAAGLTPGDRLDRSIIERLDTLGDL